MSTLYAQVCDNILSQIKSGALKVGDRLPPEADYAAELGVSRSTLRLAFSELEAAGVLKRRQRAGTEIISNAPKQHFSMATNDLHELLSLGRDTEFKIETTRSVKTDDVPLLNGLKSETGYWLEVSGTRTMSGEMSPFSVNQVYVPARFAAIEALICSEKRAVFQIIEEAFNVTVGRVNQSLRAIDCPKPEADILGLSVGASALLIEAKLYLTDGQLMEVSRATFHPERFQVNNDVQIT